MPPPAADALRLRGNAAFSRGDWDGAISAYSAALARSPADARLLSNRSAAYLSKHKTLAAHGTELRGLVALAVADAAAAAESRPDWPDAWYRLFAANADAGDDAAARRALEVGVKACPGSEVLVSALEDVRAMSEASAGCGRSGDEDVIGAKEVAPATVPAAVPAMPAVPAPSAYVNEEAKRTMVVAEAEAAARSPRTAQRASASDAARLEANEAFRRADWRGAIGGYTMSIALAEEAGVAPDRRAYSNRSAAWLRLAIDTDEKGAFASAIADADRCIGIDRCWAKAWFRKGSALLEDGRPGHAREVFLEGLLHCPGNPVLSESLEQADQVILEEGVETDGEDYEEELAGDGGLVAPRPLKKQERQGEWTAPATRVERVAVATPPMETETPTSAGGGTSVPRPGHRRDVDFSSSASGRVASDTPIVMARPQAGSTEQDGGEWMKEPPRRPQEEEKRSSKTSSSPDVDRPNQTLYEILNVPANASDAVIRRSYYLAARELHPDKNPDDPDATDKFQRVSDAYQVLSNAESRALYDKHGEAGLEKGGIDAVDPQTLFAIVFGSDQFLNFIGELKLASLASNVDEDGKAPDEAVLDAIQRDRVRKLVFGLVGMLQPWVAGDRDAFVRWAEAEVERLADTNFGADLLGTVGNVYVSRVDILMGKGQVFGLHSLLKDARYRRQKLSAQMKANAATRTVMHRQRQLHDRVMKLNRDGEAISEVEAEQVAAEMARNAVDMMWKISVLDIREVLETVVETTLSGRDITREDVEMWYVRKDEAAGGLGTHAYDRVAESNRDLSRGTSLRRARSTSDEGDTQSRRMIEGRSEIIAARAAGIRMLGKMMMSGARRIGCTDREASAS